MPTPSQLSPWPSPNTPPEGMAGVSVTKFRKPTKQPQTDADVFTGLDSLWEGGRKSFHLTLSFIHQVSTLRPRGQALGSRVHHHGHYRHLPNTTCPVPSQETLQLCVLSSTGTHLWPRAAMPALPISRPAELCPFTGVTWHLIPYLYLCLITSEHGPFPTPQLFWFLLQEWPPHILCPLLFL